MTAVIENFKSGVLSSTISDTDTSLSSVGYADIQPISGNQTMTIVLDPEGISGDPEIVTITAHVASSNTVTVTRALNNRAHNAGTKWVHSVVAQDYQRMGFGYDAAVDMSGSDNAGRKISVTSTEPTSPTVGDLWVETS